MREHSAQGGRCMAQATDLTRRQWLRGSMAAAGLAMLGGPDALEAAEDVHKWALADVTPSTVAGPFYPLLNKPVDRDTDLTLIDGRAARAQGPVLYLAG